MNKIPLLFALLMLACATPKKEGETLPNIIFIFADDMTYDAINSLGNTEIYTPNLDRIVAEGTTFTHAYNMGAWNGAVCVASRAMLISGRSLWNAKAYQHRWEMDKTWGKLLEQQGYDTYMTGKWHVDIEPEHVFGTVRHVRSGMPDDAWEHQTMVRKFDSLDRLGEPIASVLPIGYNRPKDKNDALWSPADTRFGGYWKQGMHWNEVLKQDALDFMDKANQSDAPFFMYLAFNAPHDPRQAPQEYLDRYPLENISLPKSWLPQYPFKEGIGSGQRVRDEALAPFPRTEYALKKHLQEYYALITYMDVQIGEILERLKASGKMQNTYVVFTADHGLAIGKHGLMGKQNLFDHSTRVPFMVMGPDIPRGKHISEDIYIQDAMATTLDWAKIEKPNYVEFQSLLPLIHGQNPKGHYPAIYGGYRHLQRMIRKDHFKLLVYPELDKVLLFDLKEDPEEMTDLSSRVEYASKVDTLFRELIQLQKQWKDTVDLSRIYSKVVLTP